MRDDDPALELLSRHLDGDLGEAEERALLLRLESDDSLRLELDALAQVPAAMRRVAEAERPPAMLDRIVEPLVVGPVPPARCRPRLPRLLAVAAAAVIGATLVVELAERRFAAPPAGPAARTLEPRSEGSDERFAMAPLPSRAPGEEERPRGAVERLLAEGAPEVAAADDVPPPLEVLGPLDVPADGALSAAGGDLDPGPGGGEDSAPRAAAGSSANAPPSSAGRSASSADIGREATAAGKAGSRIVPREADTAGLRSGATAAQGQLLVFLEGETAWRSFEPRERCDPGRYAVRVRIEGGTVRKVWPVWKPLAAPTESLQASELVLGLEIDGVADGEYPAEIVFEAARTRSR